MHLHINVLSVLLSAMVLNILAVFSLVNGLKVSFVVFLVISYLGFTLAIMLVTGLIKSISRDLDDALESLDHAKEAILALDRAGSDLVKENKELKEKIEKLKKEADQTV